MESDSVSNTEEFNDLGLPSETTKLFVEKPNGWRYKLFVQLLNQQISQSSYLRNELSNTNDSEFVDNVKYNEFPQWLSSRWNELMKYINLVMKYINDDFQDAIRQLDQEGNCEPIKLLAFEIGKNYRNVIKLTLKIKRTHVDELFTPVIPAFFDFTNKFLTNIETLGPNLAKLLKEADASDNESLQVYVHEFELVDSYAVTKFAKELEKINAGIR
jgi:hypothetical protein